MENFQIDSSKLPGAQLQLLVNILARVMTIETFLLEHTLNDHEGEEKIKIIEQFKEDFAENLKNVSEQLYVQFASVNLNEILKKKSK